VRPGDAGVGLNSPPRARLRITEVATLDRRHFSVIRPANGAFDLVP
jgi:hypothetical protein